MTSDRARTVTVALLQTVVGEDQAENMRRAAVLVREAAARGGQIICLPELYSTRYFPHDDQREVAGLAETVPGPSTELFGGLARELGVVIVVPLFECSDGHFFNTACVIDADGTLLGAYRKTHIPHDPFFYERSYFEPGDTGFRVFRTRYGAVAPLICYDQWFPEAARAAALGGAEIIFYPTAIGYLPDDPLSYEDWRSAWETIQRSHAIASAVHVAAVNRVGQEGTIRFWGSSFISDAFGKVLERGTAEDEEIVLATVDLGQNMRVRQGWGFMRNRRPETYRVLTEPAGDDRPADLGFAMPAEWAPHEATWLAWPYDRDTFPDRIERVERVYVRMIDALQRTERVHLVVRDRHDLERVGRILTDAGIDINRVEFHVYDYADVWFRDYGPQFLTNRERDAVIMVHWDFNAWGDKYVELKKDANIPLYMREELGVEYFKADMVLEGGGIEVNGCGTLLTTEQCLLNANRNAGMARAAVERFLAEYLGASHVIWLTGGIEGDDTDGHIDNLARFVDERTVIYAYTDDEGDPNYAPLRRNVEILSAAKDQDGGGLTLIGLPLPAPAYREDGGERRRLPMSYLNFYIANDVVLAPVYNDENDAKALQTLARVFPDRRIVPIDCRDLVYGSGAIHCVTQQQPAIH